MQMIQQVNMVNECSKWLEMKRKKNPSLGFEKTENWCSVGIHKISGIGPTTIKLIK